MRNLAIRVGIGVCFFFIIIAVVGFFLPTQYVVYRTIEIDASKADIHAWVIDLDKWAEWGPWAEGDPTLKITPGEIRTGVGASQSWTGRDGHGELAITSANPDTGIVYDLAFMHGRYQCESAFTYEDVGSGTKVTWQLAGDTGIPVFGGYLALLMDQLMGPMFDKGLQKLKAKVEG